MKRKACVRVARLKCNGEKQLLGEVDLVEIICTKCCPTLGAFAEAGVIAIADTLRTEDMETFREHGVFLPSTTAGTIEFGLGEERGEEVIADIVQGWSPSQVLVSCPDVHPPPPPPPPRRKNI